MGKVAYVRVQIGSSNGKVTPLCAISYTRARSYLL